MKRAARPKHRCPWPGCPVEVDHDLWGCRQHWFAVPRELRMRLWQAYRPMQNIWTVSPLYAEAATAIQTWIAAHIASEGDGKAVRGVGNHGWVTPRADGARARCGGPGRCPSCAAELREKAAQDERQGDLPL